MDSVEIYGDSVCAILDKIATRRGPIPSVQDVINFLKTHEKLSDDKAVQISAKCKRTCGEKDKLKALIIALYDENPVSILFYVLELMNLTDLADEIFHPVSMYRQLHRVELEHSEYLQFVFFKLKSSVDTNLHNTRESFLEKERKKLLSLCLGNTADRSQSAHELGVVTWLYIQHCGRNTATIRNVLHVMQESWPPGVDKTFCDIVFHSKTGIADALDGDMENAAEHYRISKHLCAAYHDPLTKFIVSHDRRYTNQRFYEQTRSKESLQATLVETENGLCFFESDYNGCENFIRLAKRLFYLYIAMARLKVHTDLRVDEDHGDDNRVSSNDENVAKNVLNNFESLLDSNQALDPRRSMFYFVCRARLFQLRGQMGLA